jgi:membrane-bound lytic murein transglycosylase D
MPESSDFAVAYAVGPGDSIRVQDGESLSLLADWLGIGVDALLRHNGMGASATIHVGSSLKLPFGVESRAAFEERRIAYHRAIRDTYLAQHPIDGTLEHRIRQGESAWSLAERRYRIPVWLLREYNPGLDLAEVRPGTRVVIPRISR